MQATKMKKQDKIQRGRPLLAKSAKRKRAGAPHATTGIPASSLQRSTLALRRYLPNVRVMDKQYMRIHRLAEREDLSLSDVIRYLLDVGLKYYSPAAPTGASANN